MLNNVRYTIILAAVVLTAAFFFIPADADAQTPFRSFRNLTGPEKRWVIMHPFVAKKAHRISREAADTSKAKKNDQRLDGISDGGRLDAFRHAYWMARLTQEIGPRRAYRLGGAHEKGNYHMFRKGREEDGALPDEPSCTMDFLNNDVGIDVGKKNPAADHAELSEIIIRMIEEGKLFVISRDSSGHFLNCKGERIDMTKYRGQWQNPKCVVPSADRYHSKMQ